MVTFGEMDKDKPGDRLFEKTTGGGSVLDFGVYCIQLALLAFGGNPPEKINAMAVDVNDRGVDLGVSVSMRFPTKGSATFSTDLRVNLPNTATIAGTKGSVAVTTH